MAEPTTASRAAAVIATARIATYSPPFASSICHLPETSVALVVAVCSPMHWVPLRLAFEIKRNGQRKNKARDSERGRA